MKETLQKIGIILICLLCLALLWFFIKHSTISRSTSVNPSVINECSEIIRDNQQIQRLYYHLDIEEYRNQILMFSEKYSKSRCLNSESKELLGLRDSLVLNVGSCFCICPNHGSCYRLRKPCPYCKRNRKKTDIHYASMEEIHMITKRISQAISNKREELH